MEKFFTTVASANLLSLALALRSSYICVRKQAKTASPTLSVLTFI
jgi:hypothetical protein